MTRYRFLCAIAVTVALILPTLLSAQTVTTQPLAPQDFCPGQSVSVNFAVTGSLVPGNAMILQLSNPNGSFSSGFRNLGSVSTTASGTIQATIPGDIVTGTKYRFRVIASNPRVDGSDNGADVTMYALPQINVGYAEGVIDMHGRAYAIVGVPVKFRNSTKGPGGYWVNKWWNLGIGVGATPEQTPEAEPTVVYSTPGIKPIRFIAHTPNNCQSIQDMSLTVLSQDPVLPANVLIIQGDMEISGEGLTRPIWVCPGGTVRITSPSSTTIYVEAGGSVVTESLNYGVVYMKSGASMSGGRHGEGRALVIYEDGAGLPGDSANNPWHVKAPSITFDYTNVPPGGCPSLAPYTVQIKQNTNSIHSPQNDDKSDVEYWIRNGGALTSTGSGNAYYVEAGGHATINGSNGRIYLKDGATVDVQSGSNNRIFYEMQATIVNAGTDAVLLPSSGITFVSQVSSVEDNATTGASLLEIAPNPALEDVEVRVDPALGSIRQITLHSMLGETILEMKEVGTTSVRMSLADLPSGIYQVRVRTDRSDLVRKLVIR